MKVSLYTTMAEIQHAIERSLVFVMKGARARKLFEFLNLDERSGRDALSIMIDDGRVIVAVDWTLSLRASAPKDEP